MKQIDLHNLLQKAEELKVIDFLTEVIQFVNDIKPVLETMSSTLVDNVTKMPTATKKLSKVTEATEVATNEIMNTVDGIFEKTGKIAGLINQLGESGSKDVANQANTVVDAVNEDANAIMMALQVQDITSQQIAAVNHLLENVQVKLAKILSHFDIAEIRDLLEDTAVDHSGKTSMLHREIAFDPDAVDAITKKANRQDDVNLIMEQMAAGTYVDSQDKNADSDDNEEEDIEALLAQFGNMDVAETTNEPVAEEATDEFSQDDIDALFGN